VRVGLFLQLAVFGAALSLFAPVALAQTVSGAPPPQLVETLAGDAKRDYEAGKRLYENGDYAGALSKLQNASRASSDPRLLWDAAACERAMQHYARAIALVHRYLDSHSPLIGPEAARDAQGFLRAAELRTARLDVQSSEPGAVVSVDGEPQGAVSLAADMRIDLGTHQVTVNKDGFAEYATTLTIVSSADVHVTAVLAPIVSPDGRLVVHARSGDTIAVDGAPVGLGTWTGLLPPGPHSVRVTEPDSSPFESEVVIEERQTRSIDVTLRPAPRAARLPAWAWIAGGTVLAAGAVTAGYFAFRSSEPLAAILVRGSAGTVNVP
jgi:PEGA domain-containing protein